MILTQITVSYGGTQSLPEYSNCKVNISLTATIDPDDDPAAVEAALWAHAKESAHAQIDSALEANDKAAKYDPSPRYEVLQTYWNQWDHRGETKPPQYVVIAPQALKLDRYAYAQKLIHAGHTTEAKGLRYAHAQRVAADVLRDNEDFTLLDCASGDLTALEQAIGAAESNPEVAPTPESPF